MAKKNLNWTEIRARYESGEPVRTIWPDYKNCKATMIYNKASRDGWKKEKEKKEKKILAEVEKQVVANVLLTRERLLEELCHVAYADMQDYATVDPGGGITLKAFEEMPDGATRAIGKLKEKRKILSAGEGDGDNMVIDSQMEYGHWDKLKAIGMLLDALPEAGAGGGADKKRIVVEFKKPERSDDGND